MKLSECKLGVLVQAVNADLFPLPNGVTDYVGHVVGLVFNVQDQPEIIPVVKFAGRDEPLSIHHANLVPFKD